MKKKVLCMILASIFCLCGLGMLAGCGEEAPPSNLIEEKVIDYINAVDDISPAPGGGSVASLVGALGVGLAKMLALFSINKKKFKESSKRKQD